MEILYEESPSFTFLESPSSPTSIPTRQKSEPGENGRQTIDGNSTKGTKEEESVFRIYIRGVPSEESDWYCQDVVVWY